MARSMTITPVLNGFIVEVGCQKVVIGSIPILMHEIGRYYTNPDIVEEDYMKNVVNRPCKLEFNPPPGKAVLVSSEDRKDPLKQKPDVGGYTRAGREY